MDGGWFLLEVAHAVGVKDEAGGEEAAFGLFLDPFLLSSRC